METIARDLFNASFSDDKYQGLIAEIDAEFKNGLDFRVAESPIFVGKDLKIKILNSCNAIIDSIKKPEFKALTDRAIPQKNFVSGENPHPNCLAIDFAICKNEEGEFEPQLIELQGFPSLFAYQSYLSAKYKKHFDVSAEYSPFFNRLNGISYQQEMKKFLLGDLPKEHTIILEIYPETQKTRLDFLVSKAYWGIETVCVTKIIKEGKKLFYERDGAKIEIKRIYNRLIFDDLERNYPDIQLPFDLKEELYVTWISHPNWFYRVSKFCMPLLKAPYVPETVYLDSLKEIPADLSAYVLKPLFSFAGAGVIIDIESADIEAIKDPENYILQKKINYAPCIRDDKGGLIKCEVRMLYIWPDGSAQPKLMTNLARLSRGKMIGVSFNKDFDWVGGSAAFFETN